MHPVYAVLIFGCFLLYMWCLVIVVLSHLSGWHALAKNYADANRTEKGDSAIIAQSTYSSLQGRFGIGYSHCVHVVCYDDAIRLSVIRVARIGHPPLLIPREDISDVHVSIGSVLGSHVRFRVQGIEWALYSKVADSPFWQASSVSRDV